MIIVKIRGYEYYYEASPDNFLIYTLFTSSLVKVLREFYQDNRIPTDPYDEIIDAIPDEENPLDAQVIVETWKWIEQNFNEQDIYLLKLYDIYKENRDWRRERFELPDTSILTWSDIAREFNNKFPQNKRVTVNALGMRLGNLHRIIKRRVVS